MTHVETLHLSHLPSSISIHIALYRDLQNASFLRQQLLSGNSDFEYAFIDASMVFSRAHVLAAVFRAVNDYLNGRLKSRNVHSEIVFSLSPTNNIADSFRKFGLTDSTRDLLVVKVSSSPEVTRETVSLHLQESVQGTLVHFDDDTLSTISDLPKIRKAYKLGPLPSLPSTGVAQVNGARFNERRQIEVSLLGAIALRGAT